MAIGAGIDEALALLPQQMDTPPARVLLLAIGLQESRFEHRFQVVDGRPGVKGPARGFWQFERGGGCAGVLRHNASKFWMHTVCGIRNCEPKAGPLWNAIENDDVLAAAAARLLLFTDPKRLPGVDDEAGAWELYLRTWRPGAVTRDATKLRAKWSGNHALAREFLDQVQGVRCLPSSTRRA